MARGLIIGIVTAGVLAAAGLLAYDRILAEQATERRALIARNAEVPNLELAPGWALACLETEAGSSIAKACEVGVFATPQALLAAVAFVAERLKLIEAAQALAPGQRDFFAAERRASGRDRARWVRHCRACARANLWLHGGEVRGLRAAERHRHTQGRSRRSALREACRAL